MALVFSQSCCCDPTKINVFSQYFTAVMNQLTHETVTVSAHTIKSNSLSLNITLSLSTQVLFHISKAVIFSIAIVSSYLLIWLLIHKTMCEDVWVCRCMCYYYFFYFLFFFYIYFIEFLDQTQNTEQKWQQWWLTRARYIYHTELKVRKETKTDTGVIAL